jgi:hypothetical protein
MAAFDAADEDVDSLVTILENSSDSLSGSLGLRNELASNP